MIKLIKCFVLSLWFFSITNAQIIVDKKIYKVNFSNELHVPRWVSYMLYKGGGPCNRNDEGFRFTNDIPGLKCAKDGDYSGSGYEKGHLANAEDFAFDCKKEELTFRYYNCIPQTTSANHATWLAKETEIRKWSQKEKLYIICGGFYKSKKMGKKKDIAVPAWCWKIVQSTKTKKVLFCAKWSNAENSKMTILTIAELEEQLKSKIILLK